MMPITPAAAGDVRSPAISNTPTASSVEVDANHCMPGKRNPMAANQFVVFSLPLACLTPWAMNTAPSPIRKINMEASSGSIRFQAYSRPMLTTEIQGHVATLWLDRPEKLNAMSPEFWDGMPSVMAGLDADPEVRVIVIAGKGKAFSVGLDLEAFGPAVATGTLGSSGGSEASKRAALLEQVKSMQRAISAAADASKPVIAAIHGYCIGGAVDLITACDIRIASEDAIFSVRETKLAMVADVGTLQRLPKIIDPGWVAEMAFTGRDITAAEAKDAGLVSRLFATPDDLFKAATELAESIAANSPLTVQGAKKVLRATANMPTDQALDYAALWSAAFLESDDIKEAMAAFLEGRDPQFRGE